MNKLLKSKLSFVSFLIAIYIALLILILALLLIPISKNYLSYSLTLAHDVKPDSILLIGFVVFCYLIFLISPILFNRVINSKKIIESNSIIWNFIFILITIAIFLSNTNNLIELFHFKSKNYFYYELIHFDLDKMDSIGLKNYYRIDNNKIVASIYFLSILILFIECFYLSVIIPLKQLQIKFKIYGNTYFSFYHSFNIVLILLIFCPLAFLLDFNSFSNTTQVKKNNKIALSTPESIKEVKPASKTNEEGITYSGHLDNGRYVSLTIKMIGESTYLISNSFKSRMSLLSNGRYLIEDGPMVGMTIFLTSDRCDIYSIDGEFIETLTK